MSKQRWVVCLLALCLIPLSSGSRAMASLTVDELVARNMEAAGGKAAVDSIQSYTFRLGPQHNHALHDGRLKITTGSPPAITGAILIDRIAVKRNILNSKTESEGIEKATYQTMARLYGGLFTLSGFADVLKSEGMRRFGPKNFHVVSASLGDLAVEFNLDADDFTIKRMALTGYDPVNGKLEVNYDFGPYQAFDGIRIPGSWFRSQVGIRGETNSVSDVKLNPPFNEADFASLQINVGTVKFEEGVLYGNIMEVGAYEKMMNITTNWLLRSYTQGPRKHPQCCWQPGWFLGSSYSQNCQSMTFDYRYQK